MSKSDEVWHDELNKPVYREPDTNKRECCLAQCFGGFDGFKCDVHVGNFHGLYELKAHFCMVCGRNLDEYREVYKEHLKIAHDIRIEDLE